MAGDNKWVKSVEEVAWHRNGVGGTGFYAVRFTADIEPDDGRLSGCDPTTGVKDAKWLAILFDAPGECAVICTDLLATKGVKFAGGNSWRGDGFEPELRAAIENTPSSGSIRVGPFALPIE